MAQSVEVLINGEDLLRSRDPENDVRVAALTEIRTSEGYEPEELYWVAASPEFLESCRSAAARVRAQAKRGRGSTPERRDKAESRHEELYRVTVRYPKPRTRGWLNRKLK